MKLQRTLLASLLVALAFISLTRSTNIVAKNNESPGCILVTVLKPYSDLFIPQVLGSGNGFSLRKESNIGEVTEDTGGCLKFVGDTIHFTINAGETGGTASVDIGQVREGIRLYDDGTNGDLIPTDGIYERDYVTQAVDIARSAKITGHFISTDGKEASPEQASGVVTITDWESNEISTDPFLINMKDPITGDRYAENRVVIEFSEGTTYGEVKNILVDHNLTLASWIPEALFFEVALKSEQSYESIKQEMITLPSVSNVDHNYEMTLLDNPVLLPDERMPVDQSNYLNPIRAKLGWQITKGSKNIKVATADTGVNENHPEFIGQIDAYYTCPICSTGDYDGHGTFIAGLIAAEQGTSGISGISPGVSLIVDQLLTLNSASAISSIYYAMKSGARVISLSLCYEHSIFKRAIKDAHNNNVVVVAAVPETDKCGGAHQIVKDDQQDGRKVYPASYTEVLAVGSSESDDTVAAYSDWGDDVVYAPVPSSGILSTDRSGGYALKSGTSFAAPQVAALAGLIISANPGLNNDQVVNIITGTADPVTGKSGYGRINVYRALKVASGQPDPGSDPLPLGVSKLYARVVSTPTLSVNLTWTPPASDYAGVHIYRKNLDTQNMEQLEGGLITGISYIDQNVSMESAYEYYVFAVDATGQESIDYDSSGTVYLAPQSMNNLDLEFVSQTGGAIFAVDIQDNYAYIGLGQRIGVLNITDPSNPTLLARSQLLDNTVIDLAKQGSYIYAVTISGLDVFDVGNPVSPILVNNDIKFSISGAIEAREVLEVGGSYAYLTTGQNLLVFNLSDPAHPTLVNSIYLPANRITIDGNYAYVITYPTLKIFNLDNPITPVQIGSYSVGSLYSVAVSNGFAYVADTAHGVRILDVSEPSTPTEKGLIPGNPGTVAVEGTHLYFDHINFGGLHVYDVTNPSAPIELGYLSGLFPTNVKIDTYFYAPDRSSLDLRIVDISNPSNPVEVGSYTPITPKGINLYGNKAYIGDYSGLRIVDISNPATPKLLGSFKQWWKRDVALYGNYAYVTNGNTVIHIIDVSNPNDPQEVREYHLSGIANSIEVADSKAFVADGTNGLRVLSLANPTNPIEVGFYDTAWNTKYLDIDGDYLYLGDFPIINGDWNGGGLSIIDIKDPTHPALASFYTDQTPNHITSVAANANFAYVTSLLPPRLQVIDARLPNLPKKDSTIKFNPSWYLSSIAMSDGYAYIGTSKGLVVIDVSNPLRPYIVTTYSIGFNWIDGVTVQGDYVYLATSDKGLWILRMVKPN